MFDLTSCGGTRNAISSPESPAGRLPSETPDGLMIGQSGQGPRRASLSPRQAEERGTSDERHLWPHFHHLIRECRPGVVFGEQVEAAINHGWLDLVQTDLEGEGYAFGAVGMPAAGVGAPHIRQRLWWVAEDQLAHAKVGGSGAGLRDSGSSEQRGRKLADGGSDGRVAEPIVSGRQPEPYVPESDGPGMESKGKRLEFSEFGSHANFMADAMQSRRPERRTEPGQRQATGSGELGVALGDTNDAGLESGLRRAELQAEDVPAKRSGFDNGAHAVNGFWRNADWLGCRDGKWRPVEPGTFPLAYGVSARVGQLRAYGNAIVPSCAEAFIRAYLDFDILG